MCKSVVQVLCIVCVLYIYSYIYIYIYMYMQTVVCGKREMEGRLVLYKSLRCKRLRPSFHPCFRSTRAGRGEERRRERSVLLERDSEADRRVRLGKIGGGGRFQKFFLYFSFFFFFIITSIQQLLHVDVGDFIYLILDARRV